MAPNGTLPIVFEMGHPMRGAHQWRTTSTNRIGDLHAVRASAKSNILNFVEAICGACRAWFHCASAPEVVIRVQPGKAHVGALRASMVLQSIGAEQRAPRMRAR